MRRREFLGLASLAALPATLRAQPSAGRWRAAELMVDQFVVPNWYRDAKLGLWAHWGPQCAPEAGDWYGRHLYLEDHPQAVAHRRLYGHPADRGFIDAIAGWRAEKWDPAAIVAAFKQAGARFIVAMACHHDNFDLFASSYHPWNSTRLGPRRDIVGEWEAAVRGAGLRFGVSNHSSHAWHWWQTAYGYDTTGPRKSERYDAFRLTAADGRGTAWEGLDPQQLYTGRWMAREGEAAIYGSRPWRTFGGDGVRFTVNRGRLFALLLDPRPGTLALAALGRTATQGAAVARVERIGGAPLPFVQRDDALQVTLHEQDLAGPVPVLAIEGEGLA